MARRKLKHCDYCGKSEKEIPLMEGPGADGNGRTPNQDPVFICPVCVDAVKAQFLAQGISRPKVYMPDRLPSPRELYAELDRHVIGQEGAKKVLSVAVYNHYKRLVDEHRRQHGLASISFPDDLGDVQVDKSNVLLLGPTGSGKTLLARTLADFLDVPFAIGDATTVTEAGYVGEDVENLILKLVQAADHDLERAESGIIYIDEIDKIAKKGSNASITRDVSGEGVQQALLKIIEGTVCNVPPVGGRKHPEQQYLQVNTQNILFIVGGAFVGLEEIIAKRVGKRQIGFGVGALDLSDSKQAERDKLLEKVTNDDLIKFGMIPEFVGRCPVKTALHALSEEALVKVLTEPRHALLKQYRKLGMYDGANLEFTPQAVREIAKLALKEDTGARALRSIVERVLLDIQFNLADYNGQTIVVTDKMVRGEEVLSLPPEQKAA